MPLSIGLDFGTARSGYSWCGADRAVQVRQRWRGSAAPYAKTLTALLYERRGGRFEVVAWGWEALGRYKQLKPEELERFVYVSRFKLLLADPEQYSSVPDVKLPPGKSVTDVISDFLRFLKEAALAEINLALQQPDRSALKWVITVPAGWGQDAMQTMREAAVRAGIVAAGRDERLTFAFEPEAAAISSLNNQAALGLRDGNTLVVVDAGGGTVDFTAHKVVDKGIGWSLEEASVREGLLKGAIFVDGQFEDHLCGLLGRGAYLAWAASAPQEHLRLLHHKWEEAKMAFDGEEDAVVELAWSKSLTCLFDDAGLAVEADDGELRLTAQAMRELFDAVIGDIISNVSDFIDKLPSCDHVILVGGFGESKYLLKRLQAALGDHGCRVLSPAVPSQAVLAGAALYGQNESTVASRRMAFAFGLCATTLWNPSHRADLKFFPTGNPVAHVANVFDKFVSVGEEVAHDQIVRSTCSPLYKGQRAVAFNIFMTRNNKARYTDEAGMRLLAVVELLIADPSRVIDPDSYELRVDFHFGSTELTVTAMDMQTGMEAAVELRFAGSSPFVEA